MPEVGLLIGEVFEILGADYEVEDPVCKRQRLRLHPLKSKVRIPIVRSSVAERLAGDVNAHRTLRGICQIRRAITRTTANIEDSLPAAEL